MTSTFRWPLPGARTKTAKAPHGEEYDAQPPGAIPAGW